MEKAKGFAFPNSFDICAIFVTFFPDARFLERLNLVRSQVSMAIVVDNTDGPTDFIAEDSTLSIVRNGKNLGLGAALNQGIARATELGYNWAITFDQDSWAQPSLVQTLIDILQVQTRPELVGIVGCNFRDENTGLTLRRNKGNAFFAEVESVITSGSLLSLSVFKKAGQFREDFFIDFVDHEYCLRLRKLGYRVVMALRPMMIHALGESETLQLGTDETNLALVLTNRSPLRRYYMTRNGLTIARMYFLDEPVWTTKSVIGLVPFALAKLPLESGAHWKKFRAILAGIADAFRKKTGPSTHTWLRG